ncbi:hypothetical protein AKJ40_03210 [candidate division MSBL1 archaeon SCGC-AAA259M10]|uniref:Uncharacterized protein n=1 Tax=candidate division MSBL1 archaeon SCGC-AAA259M10 TaxID=1698270 RepID=A0A133UYZ6_9EURY|nr:hypothetical protein AKJ40_03210 [candidate division MSBL1 archaeon SCGC-AAA259M10]
MGRQGPQTLSPPASEMGHPGARYLGSRGGRHAFCPFLYKRTGVFDLLILSLRGKGITSTFYLGGFAGLAGQFSVAGFWRG